MVIIVKQNTKEERIRELIQWIESQNLRTHISTGDFSTVIGVIGDTSKLDEDLISGLDIVEGVKRVSEPFKSANRKFHPLDSVIEVGADKIKVSPSSPVPAPWRARIRSSPWPKASRPPEPPCSGAARSSPAPPPMTSRD